MTKCEDCEHYISDFASKTESNLCPTCGNRLIEAHKIDLIDRKDSDYNYCSGCDSYLNKRVHKSIGCPMCDKFMTKL